MRIGLLLGSFNPIHFAHLTMASMAINSNLCDKVLFVVAKQNPWKDEQAAPFELRCKMVEASIAQFFDKCEVCDLEKEIDSTSYSYIVLGLIKKKYPTDELFLIAGTDTIKKIPRWRNFDDNIKPYYKFIEIARNTTYNINLKADEEFAVIKNQNEELGEFDCIVPRITDVSSTMVRGIIKRNMNPYPYVNEGVIKIIEEYNLYK